MSVLVLLEQRGELKPCAFEAASAASAVARAAGIDHVWSTGPLCAHLGVGRHFQDMAALLAALPDAPPAAAVLVKGSRFMKMEQVVQALRGRTPAGSAHAA